MLKRNVIIMGAAVGIFTISTPISATKSFTMSLHSPLPRYLILTTENILRSLRASYIPMAYPFMPRVICHG